MDHIQESHFKRLTPREKDILKLVAEGFSSARIAAILNLSTKTVQTHRTSLRTKLNVRNVTGLVRYAIKFNLVE